jgi:hypothetical protein
MADLRILRTGFNFFSGPLPADLAELRSRLARARAGSAGAPSAPRRAPSPRSYA